MRNSRARIDRKLAQFDEIAEPELTNGESIYMFTLLLKGFLDNATPDVSDRILREVVFALKGGPNDLSDLCGIPRAKQGGVSA